LSENLESRTELDVTDGQVERPQNVLKQIQTCLKALLKKKIPSQDIDVYSEGY